MSFLAVLSLIALYEQAWLNASWRDPDGSIRISRVIGFYLAGLVITDIVAGGATALLAAYHFNRLPTYSMFTNLLAAPLTSLWIMPAAIIAMLAMPFGLERIPAHIMGRVVKALDDLARWVATWPGSQVHIQPMLTSVMVAAAFGVIFCCLWHGRGRWLGLLPSVIAFAQPAFVPIPDLLVEDSGRVVAVSDDHGHLIIRPGRAGRFVRDVWSGRYTASTMAWPKAGSAGDGSGLSCERAACRLERRGRTVVIANKPDTVQDSCGRADVIVVAAPARGMCASGVIIDREALKADGAYAVWITAQGISTRTVRQSDGARAWTANHKPDDTEEKPAA
jgi:competence protein ComEC